MTVACPGSHRDSASELLGTLDSVWLAFSWLVASRGHLVFIKRGSRTFLFFECLLVSSCSSGDSLQGRLPYNYIWSSFSRLEIHRVKDLFFPFKKKNKSLLNMLQCCFCFRFWFFWHVRILGPQPGIEPTSPVLGVWSLTHWTTR